MTAIRAYMWDRAGRHGIILCGRQFMNSLDDSSMEEVKAAIRSQPWLHAHFEIGEKYIRTRSGRIAYKFVGLDRNLDSIKSKSRILLCWVDEAEPVTDEAWVKLVPTLREEDSELWVTWNPESKRSPTHKRFREGVPDERVKIVAINWRDNPWFPDVLERTRQRDRRDRPERYDHIWEGDFAQVFEGAYYARELIEARHAGRITTVDNDEAAPVETAWDFGKGVNMAVWMFQVAADGIRVIDYLEGEHSDGIPQIVAKLAAKGYRYGTDWLPHDARVTEIGTGKTRIETFRALGRKPHLVPDHKVEDGIHAVREVIARCWFDETRTEPGLDALRQYRSEYSEERRVFSDRPLHDWTSHAADAFRYLAMAWRFQKADKPKPVELPKRIEVTEIMPGAVRSNIDADKHKLNPKQFIEMIKKSRQSA